MNYYGNISKVKIVNDLLKDGSFKEYSQKYIYERINYLYSNKMIYNYNSYAGWSVHSKNDIIDKLNSIIEIDLINIKKKVALMLQLVNSKDLCYEPYLFKQICDYII